MTVTVAMASTGLSPATVGKDQQIPMPLRLPDGTPPYDRTYTTTSSDPGRLLISTDPEAVGSATATSSTPNNFYLQALSDNGRATITATATGLIGSTAVITLTGSAVTMQPYASGNPAPAAWDGKIWNTTTQSGATSINLLVTSANPSGNGITQTGQSASIRPGAPDPIVTFQSSNPAAG